MDEYAPGAGEASCSFATSAVDAVGALPAALENGIDKNTHPHFYHTILKRTFYMSWAATATQEQKDTLLSKSDECLAIGWKPSPRIKAMLAALTGN